MKNISTWSLLFLFIIGCGPKEANQPTDLAGIKALLKEKKSVMKDLESEIIDLQEKVKKLEPNREKPAVLVSTQQIERQSFERFTTVQATVQTEDAVFVSSETGGRLLSINVKEGQYVKKGQLIARVDLQGLNDQLAELETSMTLAKDVFERQKRLWDQNIGSEIQYLQAKNAYERLQKSKASIQTQLAKANIYSPLSGVIDMEFLKTGEIAAPGAPIVQLFNPSRLKVVADIPETYLGKIKRGDMVEVYFPAIDLTLNKKVSLLGRTIDPGNRTFKIEVTTNNPNGVLKPNLLSEIKFKDFYEKDAIVVPLELIQEEVSGQKFIYTVIKENGKEKAQKSYISIGESTEGKIMIVEGLEEGDQIIIEGARSVANGDIVKNIAQQ